MEKCLVMKLKSSVDNAELLKVGELRLRVKNTAPSVLFFNGESASAQTLTLVSNTGRLTIVGNYDDGKKYDMPDTLGSEFYLWAENLVEGDYLQIPDKYNIRALKNCSTLESLSDVSYMPRLTYLQVINTCSGKVTDIRETQGVTSFYLQCTGTEPASLAEIMNVFPALTSLAVNNGNIKGDISDIDNNNLLTQATLSACPQLVGDISSIHLPSITSITCNNDANLRGSWTAFLAANYTAGMSAKTITFGSNSTTGIKLFATDSSNFGNTGIASFDSSAQNKISVSVGGNVVATYNGSVWSDLR